VLFINTSPGFLLGDKNGLARNYKYWHVVPYSLVLFREITKLLYKVAAVND